MKKLYALIMSIILTTGCTKPVQDYFVLDFENIKTYLDKSEINIDSLGWQTELIPLETSDSLLIQNVEILKESMDFYFIASNGKIFKFDKKGKFLSYIGSKGQGPQDFVSVTQIQTDDKNKYLYVMDYFGRKMIIYKYNGEFASSFPLPEDYSYNSFYLFNNVVYYISNSNSIMPDLMKYTIAESKIDTICLRNREMGIEAFMGNSFIYKYDNDIRFFHYFNDTVYFIKENHLLPCFLIRFGELKYNFEELEVVVSDIIKPKVTRDGPRVQLLNFFETPRYICLFYLYNDKTPGSLGENSYIFDKKYNRGYPNLGFKSDKTPYEILKHGQSFHYSEASNSFLQIKESHELSPFINSIQEDDNPVIIKHQLNN